MKLSKNAKVTIVLIVWSFLLYFLFFRINFEKGKYTCAVCRGETISYCVYLANSKIGESESTIKNVDEVYKKYINEKHSHLWVKNGNAERFSFFCMKYDQPNSTGLQPSFSSVYIYNTSLKLIKEDLKNGNSTDVLKHYKKCIEQIKLNSIDLESELRAKNMEISDLLK